MYPYVAKHKNIGIVFKGGSGVGMVRRKRLLVDGQGALEEGFGLEIASLPLLEVLPGY